MRVKVEANELHDADVTHVSLVGHGAIRAPFKIIKTEDLPEHREGLGERVAKWFGKTPSPAQVMAVYVSSPSADILKTIEDAGFAVDCTETVSDGVTMYKQEGDWPDGDAQVFALSNDVLVSVHGIQKEFMPYGGTTDFTETLQATAFLPSFTMALHALEDTVSNALYSQEDRSDVVSAVEKATAAFSAHVQSLARALPASVFKLEAGLRKQIEGSTVAKSSDQSEGSQMTEQLKEVVAGDHAGLGDEAVTKAEDQAPKVEDSTDGVEKQEADAATAEKDPVAKEESASDSDDGVKKEDAKAGEPAAEPEVAKEDETTDTEEEDPLKVMAASISAMAQSITGLSARLEKQDEKIEALTTATEEAVEKADHTTRVVDWGMDESLGKPNRERATVEKSSDEGDVFGNLFTGFGR